MEEDRNPPKKFQRMTYKKFSQTPRKEAIDLLSKRILNNIDVTFNAVKYCKEHNFNYRLSSDLFSLITYDKADLSLDQLPEYDQIIREYFKGRADRIKGQVDLVYKKGEFYLYATCDMPEDTPINPTDCLGIDLGVKNIAVDSSGEVFSNEKVEKTRVRLLNLRSNLQKAGTKSAKRKLKKISGKERRFRNDVNHCVSKIIVKKAKDTNCFVALEDLTNINKETTVRKKQRAERYSWAFYQLRTFINYKAKLAGIPVVLVNPRNTSRTCSVCGHCEKSNRKNQEEFCCKKCKHEDHADYNAAKNIRIKGLHQSAYCSPLNNCSKVA